MKSRATGGDLPRSELNATSILVGCVMAVVVAATTIYVGLKTPFSIEGSIPAALLAFVAMSALRREFSVKENNISQTLASAAGSIGSVTAFVPALYLMGYSMGIGEVFLWLSSVSLLGVFFAVPLRTQMVVEEKLPFPAGTACAVTLQSLHRKGVGAVMQGRALLVSGLLASAVTWLREGVPKVVPVFTRISLQVTHFNLQDLGAGVLWNPFLFGAGALVGPRVGAGLALGLVAWLFAAHHMLGVSVENARELRDWLMWPGVSLLMAGGFTGMLLSWRSLVRGLGSLAAGGGGTGGLSFGRWAAGTAVVSLVCIVVMVSCFDMNWLVAAATIPVSFLLSVVCVRVYGETGVNAVGSFAHVTQFLFGGLFTGSAPSVLLASGVTAASAQESGDLMADLKTGHILKARPDLQFVAQLLGVAVGVLVAVPIYFILVSAYGLDSAQLPIPAAHVWARSTQLVLGGAAALDGAFALRVGGGAAVGIVLAVLEKSPARKYLPSMFGLGFAVILPPAYSITLALGSVIPLFLGAADSAPRRYLPVVASGLIAGEAVTGVCIAAAVLFGLF